MLDRTLLIAVVAGALCAGAYASCANSCSGHGTCGAHDKCTCYSKWEGTDCSLRSCPQGPSFADGANEADPHALAVCSGRGTCDHSTGDCACAVGFTGQSCSRMACPNGCSGHGRCSSVNDISKNKYVGWAADMAFGCVCDAYYEGADCSRRQCPRGDDPLTVEVECQGTSSGSQTHEVQEITVSAGNGLSGEITLTHTDAYGQEWTTVPIPVGGDNTYDVRISSATTDCSFTYATPNVAQTHLGEAATTFRASTDASYPTTTACGASATNAAAIDSVISANPVFKSVKVEKSVDASSGNKFAVEIGGLNFQSNIGSEIGTFGVQTAGTATVHQKGDHSKDIERALTSLPYDVVPSVTVSRVAVDGSDDISSSATAGSTASQKYRVTFSDAANAGNQHLLKCNAGGCDEDGCAPRFTGAVSRTHVTTKTGSDPMNPTGGVTDFRSTIKATNQGSFRLRHSNLISGAGTVGTTHGATYYAETTFEAGTYTVSWEVSPGNFDTATFGYDATQAQIQTALQTIEGWEGVSVLCSGTPAQSNFDCKVTYAVGFDDGGKVPTISYTNLQIASGEVAQHVFNNGNGGLTLTAAANQHVHCQNKLCWIENGLPNALNTQDVGKYIYIKDTGGSNTGVYEIIRAEQIDAGLAPGSPTPTTTHNGAAIIYAPNIADCGYDTNGAADDSCFTGTVEVWRVTPLMVMWPEFSNTIAFHDTTMRISYGGHGVDVSQDSGDSTTLATGLGLVIHWGSYLGTAESSATLLAAASTCANYLTAIHAFSNFPVTCDCRKTDSGPPGYHIEVDIRCPGWVGYELSIMDAAGPTTAVAGSPRSSDGYIPFARHVRNSPERSLHQLVAIGDDVSIEAGSTLNAYKTFKAVSYVSDALFGDGGKNVWNLVARGVADHGLGAAWETTTGPTRRLVAEIDYSSYADYVPFLKVSPAPTDDVAITHLVAQGSNSTSFTRIIEDLSTSTYETATLYIRDKAAIPATPASDPRNPADPRAISGTFQLTYDGAETATIQAQATAAEMQEALASLTTLSAVPTVTHRAVLDYLVWTITFDGQTGDAAKLKFKYIASGSEMKSSLLVGTDGNYLINGGTANTGAGNDQEIYIWMTYDGQGSAFIDALDETSATVHDELAMDVAAGTTFNVTSQEIYHWFLFDETSGAALGADVYAGANTELPNFVFEYQGQFSSNVKIVGASDFNTEANIAAVITAMSGMETLRAADVQCDTIDANGGSTWAQAATIDTLFNSFFPWGASHIGSAGLHCAFTLPLGADGASFNIHTVSQEDTVQWVSSRIGQQTYTYRQRNNNGRTFTVTRAYENKVSDLISVQSTIAPNAAPAGTAAASTSGLYGDVTAAVVAVDGGAVYTPGVHHDIPVYGLPASGGNVVARGMSWVSGSCTNANLLADFPVATTAITIDNGQTIQCTGAAATVSGQHTLDCAFLPGTDSGDLGATTVRVGDALTYTSGNGCKFTVSDTGGTGARAMAEVDSAGNIVKARITTPGRGYLATGQFHLKVPGDTAEILVTNTPDTNVLTGAALPGTTVALGGASCGSAVYTGSVFGFDTAISSTDGSGNAGTHALTGATGAVECEGTVVELELWEGSCLVSPAISGNTGITGAITRGQTRTGLTDIATSTDTFDIACDANGVPTITPNTVTTHKYMVGDHVTFAVNTISRVPIVARVKSISSAVGRALRVLEGGSDAITRDHTSTLDYLEVGTSAVDEANSAATQPAANKAYDANALVTSYTVASMYDTVKPQFFGDATYANVGPAGDGAANVRGYDALSVYGGRTGVHGQYTSGWSSSGKQHFRGIDTAASVAKGYNYDMTGTDEGTDTNMYYQTTSVVADDRGTKLTAKSEAGDVNAYVGRGYDTLWVTPKPDAMTGVRAVITYTGPASSCSVTQVTQGSHEGAVCSGRGNCDHATGTCVCDPGYTLEACSEQTVLV